MAPPVKGSGAHYLSTKPTPTTNENVIRVHPMDGPEYERMEKQKSDTGLSDLRSMKSDGSTEQSGGVVGKKRTMARKIRRSVCQLWVIVFVVIPVSLAGIAAIVAGLIGAAGITSAGDLADKVMGNLVTDVRTQVTQISMTSFYHMGFMMSCLTGFGIKDMTTLLYVMVQDFQWQSVSLVALMSFSTNFTLLPFGYMGEVLIQKTDLIMVDMTGCVNGTIVNDCQKRTLMTFNLTTGSGTFSQFQDENQQIRRDISLLTYNTGRFNSVTKIITVPGTTTLELVVAYSAPIMIANLSATKPTAVLTSVIRTSALSTMLRAIPVMDNGKIAIVMADGSLMGASVDATLYPFGSYSSTNDPYFKISQYTAVPILSSAGRALLDRFNGNLSTMSAGIHTQEFKYGSERGLMSYAALDFGLQSTGLVQIPMFVMVVVPYSEVYGSLLDSIRNAGLAGGFSALGILLIFLLLVTHFFLKPMKKLTDDLRRLTTLKFETTEEAPKLSLITEVREMQLTTRKLEEGLLAFAKFLPRTVVRILLRNNKSHHLGMIPRDVTIHFSDIVNFTGISESLSPEQLIDVVGEYLQEMSTIIIDTGGTIDKFIGDAIMAFWNAPDEVPRHSYKAVEACIRCQTKLKALHVEWARGGLPALKCRVGLNCGKVLVGNYGCDAKMDFTIIGDPVNLASRLEGLNKKYETTIMIAADVFACEGVSADYCCRLLGRVAVKGKTKGVDVYEVIGFKSEVSSDQLAAAELYTNAIQMFHGRQFKAALENLNKYPNEGKALEEMKKSCQQYIATPPPENWDGVEHIHEKF